MNDYNENKNDFSWTNAEEPKEAENKTEAEPSESGANTPIPEAAASFSSDDNFGQHVYSVPENRPVYSAPITKNGSQIYYNPVPPKKAKKKKQNKEPKPAKLSAVIAICLVAVLLCGAAGFGGSLLAGKLTKKRSVSVNSGLTAEDAPLVIYRDTSDLPVSSITPVGGVPLTYAQVAALIKDSVVEINTEFMTRSAWFQYVDGGAGSGVILSADGYIATNAHVVMNNDSSALADTITVRLPDGTEYEAVCKGYDTDADIAVLKVEAENLIPVVCGNSDTLAVGEEVMIVGNPLGELGGTVTNGIVSATEREIEVSGTKMTLIQTNAAVNPGNSGGGMFNMKGELVGIVNAKSSGSGIEGLGFAIPVNDAISVTEQLMEYGFVRGRVMLGIIFQNVSSSSYYYYYNIKPGVYVQSLTEGYNDDVLKVGDRVIAVNGEEITSSDDIKSIISDCSVGDKIKFQLYRDNKLIEVEVTCYEKLPAETEPGEDVNFDEDTDIFEDNGEIEEIEPYYVPNNPYDAPDVYVNPYEDFFNDFFGRFFG